MSVNCCECGRRVPQILVSGKWQARKCPAHPNGKRYGAGFAAKWFRLMHDVCSGELAAQIASVRECRKPYLPPALSDIMPKRKGSAL